MTGIEAYLLAMAYTKKAIEGAGALKGAACQIKSIAPITGGNRVTFLWEDNEGVQSEDYMDVMNGADGADGTDGTDGVGISSITFKEKDVDGNNVYTVTLTNSNTYDIVCPKGAQGETGSTGATGNGIASITKTGTEGLVDTYTITYTNGTTSTFTVTNGAGNNEFIGTLAEWNNLTTAEKKAFDTYQITDDYSEALMPNYSTTEQKTGQKWIDGKDIYFKTIDIGALPDNSYKIINHGISGFERIIDVKLGGYSDVVGASVVGSAIYYLNYATTSEIRITTAFIASSYDGVATLYYTKTA